jgi:hypothetical protein
MKASVGKVVAVAAVVGFSALAEAHDLRCDKTVNGEAVNTIDTFPASVTWQITVADANPSEPSTALSVSDPLLAGLEFVFMPVPPFTLQVDEHVSSSFMMTLGSFADCAKLTGSSADDQTVNVDNMFTVTWDVGSAQCSARLVCVPPTLPPPSGATRTMGFWKTHEQALTLCLAGGDIDLGFITISSLDSALGLLWGSPSRFGDKETRAGLDKARFLLGRQTLAAICNERLFGTQTSLITMAIAALSGTDCASMTTLEGEVDALNGSGDSVAFPSGFNPGPATPQDAQAKAIDPTTPSGGMCQ